MGKSSIAFGWCFSLGLLAYGIYGLLHNGVYIPMRHSSGGYLLNGIAAWTALLGVVMIVVDQSVCLFVLPPGTKANDAPVILRVLRFGGALLIIAGGFLPGAVHVDHFPF